MIISPQSRCLAAAAAAAAVPVILRQTVFHAMLSLTFPLLPAQLLTLGQLVTSERQLFNSWLPDTEDEDEETDGAGPG